MLTSHTAEVHFISDQACKLDQLPTHPLHYSYVTASQFMYPCHQPYLSTQHDYSLATVTFMFLFL